MGHPTGPPPTHPCRAVAIIVADPSVNPWLVHAPFPSPCPCPCPGPCQASLPLMVAVSNAAQSVMSGPPATPWREPSSTETPWSAANLATTLPCTEVACMEVAACMEACTITTGVRTRLTVITHRPRPSFLFRLRLPAMRWRRNPTTRNKLFGHKAFKADGAR